MSKSAPERPRRKPGPKPRWETQPPRVVETFAGAASEAEVWARVAEPLGQIIARLELARRAAAKREDDVA